MTSKTKQFFENQFNKYIVNKVNHYQKKYGFDMQNGSTHNNEADAFKHTFMQAFLAIYGTQNIAKKLGDMHERDGNIRNSQPKGEEIMDQHNNAQGREIAAEIINKYGLKIKSTASIPYIHDIIAKYVYERMQRGDIILDPSGRRKLKNVSEKWDKHGNVTYTEDKQNIKSAPKQSWDRYGNLTGFAADIPNEEKIERYKKENELFSPENRVFYENELNPAKIPLGSFEDNYVQEFVKQYIDSGKNLPSEKELQSKIGNGELIYVRNYTGADGTKVSGYYRTK